MTKKKWGELNVVPHIMNSITEDLICVRYEALQVTVSNRKERKRKEEEEEEGGGGRKEGRKKSMFPYASSEESIRYYPQECLGCLLLFMPLFKYKKNE